MIVCQSLTKRYGSLRALDSLDLEITGGDPVGLVGANGAGKSTLFATLCGFIKPTAGEVSIFDQPVDSPTLKGKIGILPQDVNMFRNLSVFKQLCHFARLQGYRRQEAINESNRVLSLIDIKQLAKQYPETLSFGQRKKVMLAQALIGNPDLILLDEPTSGLDPVAVNDIHKLFGEIGRQAQLIISSHNLAEIEDICQQIIVLNKGKLVKTSSINELKHANQCFSVTLDRPANSVIEHLQGLENVEQVLLNDADNKLLQIYFNGNNANKIQIAIINKLNDNQFNVVEISRGATLADEVSELLRSSN
ncbi:MAG: ABC transporter ATP-binding protein [Pseudomonadota bacterium]